MDEATTVRQATVLRLRREGLTFTKIGAMLAVSRSRAAQLYEVAARREATLARGAGREPTPDTPIEHLKLSDRAFNALRNDNYKTLSDLMTVHASNPAQLIRTPNFDKACLNEVLAIFEAVSVQQVDPAVDQLAAGPPHDRAASQDAPESGVVFGAKEWDDHARLVGAVTLGWNRNVYQLLRVFTHLTGIETPMAEAIFFSPQADSSQRRMIKQVAKAAGISKRDQATLEALLKRLETVSKGRNLAAHIIFGLSAFDPETGQWGPKVVPALDPPQDIRLDVNFTAQFKRVEADLHKIFLGFAAWLDNTPYPARQWTGPPLPIAAARDGERARLGDDFDETPFARL